MLNRVINRTSKELGLSEELVEKVYKEYWKTIRDYLQENNLKEDLTEEQFKSLRTNINISSIGKFYCTHDRYIKAKKRNRYNVKDKEN